MESEDFTATEAQLEYIRDLGGKPRHGISKQGASILIDYLVVNRPPSLRQRMVARFFGRIIEPGETRWTFARWMDDWYKSEPARLEAWETFKATWESANPGKSHKTDADETDFDRIEFGIGLKMTHAVYAHRVVGSIGRIFKTFVLWTLLLLAFIWLLRASIR